MVASALHATASSDQADGVPTSLPPFIPPSKPATGGTGTGLERPVIQTFLGNPASFGIAGIFTAAAVVFFAYTGFEAVANMSEESRNPRRDMPRGLLWTLGIATALYMGVSFVLTGMSKHTDRGGGSPLASAFDAEGPSWAGTLVSIAAVCGLSSVILVDLMGIGRIGFAMGRDGLLPPTIAKVHPKFGTPLRFTVGATIMVMVVGGLIPLTTLADLVSIGALFAFTLVSIAVPVLRHTRPKLAGLSGCRCRRSCRSSPHWRAST